jgi:hypothetical protein
MQQVIIHGKRRMKKFLLLQVTAELLKQPTGYSVLAEIRPANLFLKAG